MTIEQRMMSPFTKAKYLSEPNYKRYVAIVNFLYQQHEYYYAPPSTTKEIFESIMKKDEYGFLGDYTESMLDADMKSLEEWGNVISHADNGRVTSIQEYNKTRLRFQCTPETIEIERMMEQMDSALNQMKGSLDASKVNSLSELIIRFQQQRNTQPLTKEKRGELHQLWTDILERFDNLRKEASDYLAIIQSRHMEEKMKDKKISVFRVKFTEYLTDFIIALQNHTYIIESAINKIEKEGTLEWAIQEMVLLQQDKPNLHEEMTEDELKQAYGMQWSGIKKWFVFDEFGERFVSYLMKQTDETISKFTKYLQQLSEREQQVKSRSKEFKHMALLFEGETDMTKCYEQFAMLTNVENPRHLLSEKQIDAQSDKSLFDREEKDVEKRMLKEAKKTPIRQRKVLALVEVSEENQQAMEAFQQEKKEEEKRLRAFTAKGKVVLKELEGVDPFIRQALLNWISKSAGKGIKKGKTETGVHYTVEKQSDEWIQLASIDGTLTMPDYVIHFKEVNTDGY